MVYFSYNPTLSNKELKKGQKHDTKARSVLILGGAGFLGANLVRRCLKEPNTKVTVVDLLHPNFGSTQASLNAVAHKIEFIQGDIRDKALLKKVLPGKDIIFNCAAQTSHPHSLHDPVFDAEINCIGNLVLLESIKEVNSKAVVVYTSSSTVVGKAVGDVIDESHGERPLDIYSANKGVAEKYYRIFHRVYDIPTVVLRFANLYGPLGKNDPSFGFVNYFIHQAKTGKTIKIFGDGMQTRNLMFADDATEIMWLAAHEQKLAGETYFAAHQDHHTVKEIAETIVDIFGSGAMEYTPWPDVRKRIEIEHVIISSARLHYVTGWKPNFSLKEGLRLTKQRMESNDY